MLDTPEIVTTRPQTTAVVRLTIPRTQIRHVMGPAIGEVISTVTEQGIMLAGPLFSYHPRIDPEVFDFEVGVPVTTPVAPAGRVESGVLPAMKVARTIYHGPYEGLGPAWGELDAWMRENGHTPAAGIWECYLAGPESGSDPALWRTQLNHPVAG